MTTPTPTPTPYWKRPGREFSLYHCTPYENLHKIEREGLLPPTSLSIGVPMISFVGSITEARRIAVLEVSWYGLTFVVDDDGPGYLRTEDHILPSQITWMETVDRPAEGW